MHLERPSAVSECRFAVGSEPISFDGPVMIWIIAADRYFCSAPQGVGVALFWSARSLWFDLYFALSVAVFAAAWILFAPHPWAAWSILGSALILFTSYFQVRVSVAFNSWFGLFY